MIPHFFALLRGEGAHGKVQRGDAGAFSGGAEFQKHSHIVGLGLYDRFEIAHGDEVSSELTGDVCGVVRRNGQCSKIEKVFRAS